MAARGEGRRGAKGGEGVPTTCVARGEGQREAKRGKGEQRRGKGANIAKGGKAYCILGFRMPTTSVGQGVRGQRGAMGSKAKRILY